MNIEAGIAAHRQLLEILRGYTDLRSTLLTKSILRGIQKIEFEMSKETPNLREVKSGLRQGLRDMISVVDWLSAEDQAAIRQISEEALSRRA